ncbi:carbamoyltransferase HypF [Microbulbifer flavimaris]|uniref:Carbamoyltransferase HypF n=1 Tax=Microbulbifer flavimaris TaxID=1781068 RepID=A0ABX4I4N2_9GAMM|nr:MULTISPECIES: carbamoyltransferase HypF [Microbulbifer]KUJ84756.1 hypothetical protein AVO43_03665 [Microbulbifer sp. ZGT114]PCO06850.1 carbamoyltransferase HypF [Microbulbifer flavimaris]
MKAERWQLDISGLVQGVGFRPHVLRLAREFGLTGWVANNSQGVQVEIQGPGATLGSFVQRIRQERPPLSRIDALQISKLSLQEEGAFSIRQSDDHCERKNAAATLLPDLAPCEACLREMTDPGDRRFQYPFTNCTHCGPRFSIVEQLPYDRANTSMKAFPMCSECEREYRDTGDRRFHAEPNACGTCGPKLQLLDRQGKSIVTGRGAITETAAAILDGAIVAMKSVGGFQLLTDATNAKAVRRLRQRKQRPAKPLALLYPDLETLRKDCRLNRLEQSLLLNQARPIVLLAARRNPGNRITAEVAPGNPNLGAMLPCSGLHHLLMAAVNTPLVATSGNLAGEPICTDNAEALERLNHIADYFLVHDRAIVRPLDDSVARVLRGQRVLLRRARGYAPLPISIAGGSAGGLHLLATGGDLKNTVAASCGEQVFVSQHIGDLQSRRSRALFEQSITDLGQYYRLKPDHILCDQHPGYASTRWATEHALPHKMIQHHVAHFFSVMAEHNYRGRALGICWDGTGYGETEGSKVAGSDLSVEIRGSEFLTWDGAGKVERTGALRPFPLVGGERAIREPRRCAAGLLYTAMGTGAFGHPALRNLFLPEELRVIEQMLRRQVNTPACSSAGRLFDAVAALLGLATENTFEGQAAMAVEFSARESSRRGHFPFTMERQEGLLRVDWQPMLVELLHELEQGVAPADIAAAFQNTLVEMIVTTATEASCKQVFLSGGVFQNRILTETAAEALEARGFVVHCHRDFPPNDGGIALGQIYYAHAMGICDRSAEEGATQCV